MAQNIQLKSEGLRTIRSVDPRLVSYNIEMTEVTGGTFWKEYTPEQIAGRGKFPMIGIKNKDSMMQVYPPIPITFPLIYQYCIIAQVLSQREGLLDGCVRI